jgi:hypothetical protein
MSLRELLGVKLTTRNGSACPEVDADGHCVGEGAIAGAGEGVVIAANFLVAWVAPILS